MIPLIWPIPPAGSVISSTDYNYLERMETIKEESFAKFQTDVRYHCITRTFPNIYDWTRY